MKGFTLIETVVYIGIGLILIASIIPFGQSLVLSTIKIDQEIKREKLANLVFLTAQKNIDGCEKFDTEITNCSISNKTDQDGLTYLNIYFVIGENVYELNYY